MSRLPSVNYCVVTKTNFLLRLSCTSFSFKLQLLHFHYGLQRWRQFLSATRIREINYRYAFKRHFKHKISASLSRITADKHHSSQSDFFYFSIFSYNHARSLGVQLIYECSWVFLGYLFSIPWLCQCDGCSSGTWHMGLMVALHL